LADGVNNDDRGTSTIYDSLYIWWVEFWIEVGIEPERLVDQVEPDPLTGNE
jgi:hypothetical protein